MWTSTHLPWFLVVFAAFFTTGCATVSQKSDLDLSDVASRPVTEQTSAQLARTPECTIVIQPARGKPQVVQMPLSEGATVQTALDHSKATKRFNRMNIHVLRRPHDQASSSAQVQKMQVEFDRRRREVKIEYDYALYPNDRVVVEEDTTTFFDDMVEKVAGKLGVPMATNTLR
jgi:hypothetical protein